MLRDNQGRMKMWAAVIFSNKSDNGKYMGVYSNKEKAVAVLEDFYSAYKNKIFYDHDIFVNVVLGDLVAQAFEIILDKPIIMEL